MTTIQNAPWRRAPFLLLFASLAIGVLLHGFFGFAIRTGEQRVLAVLLCTLVAGAGLTLGLHLAYRPFAFDAVSRTVRIGRRTVPLDTMREAWRSFQSGRNGAAYLIYGFRSTDGPTVRVMVAGRPLRGLNEAERAALAEFLRLAPIPGPADSDDALHGSLASDILADGTKVPVSAALLLRELGAAGDSAAGAAVAEQPEAAAVEVDTAGMLADDVAVVTAVRADGHRIRVARLWAARAFGVSTMLFPVLVGVAVLAPAVGWRLDEGLFLPALGLAAALLTVAGLGWSLLGDLDTRTVRRASLAWLDAASPAMRARGLPVAFHPAWLQFAPGHRMLTILAFAGGVLGMLLVLAGMVTLTTEYPLVVLIALPGILFGALAIRFWIRHRRRRRADVLWLIEAAGPRAGRP